MKRLPTGSVKRHSSLAVIIWFGLFFSLSAREVPQRIVSMAPNITETVFRLGAADRLVGRTDYCLYPPAAQQVPSVGGLLNPDYESILSFQPQAVLLLPNPDMEAKLKSLGLTPVVLRNETIADIQDGILKLGLVLGIAGKAKEVVAGIQDTLDAVAAEFASADSLEALLLIGREPSAIRGLYAAGGRTYLSELAGLCAVQNVYADVPLRYFDVSREDLFFRDPQVILDIRLADDDDQASAVNKHLKIWRGEEALTAVKMDRVFIVADRALLIPGPRVAYMSKVLAEVFHKARHK